MAYDASSFGGGWEGRWCTACREPIKAEQPFTHVHIENEPELSGAFHERCARPYTALARIMSGNFWGGR